MNIIFDLDGTISNSSEGVIATFRATFKHYNAPELADETIKQYIGPPMEETFAKYLPADQINEAVSHYRKLYKEQGGILKNSMYAGIDRLLAHLKRLGHKTYVATTKDINASKTILKNFGIIDLFDGVYGVNTAEGLYTKTDVLNRLFEETGAVKDDSILIGDTIYDANGAEDVGIIVAIVLYGFGTRQSLAGKKVEFFVDTVEELFHKFPQAKPE
ncbi:MAG: HAD hydrolase-like protein [Clostridia bacterium]|nr:HAD hydrolase-like protein [Clostridia bacterium]